MSSDKSQEDAAHGLEPLACVACRARKLKCDRAKGRCNRCVKIDNECVYPESRRKPTFKRRNVKELEARLAQVEYYLKEANKGGEDAAEDVGEDAEGAAMQLDDFDIDASLPGPASTSEARGNSDRSQPPMVMSEFEPTDDFLFDDGGGQLMGLGMTEALPPFEVMEELNNAYFRDMHHLVPVVHPGRYLQAFYGNAVRKPPMCLQYAIWALGSYGHDKYGSYSDVFYRRARQYIETDEMKSYGETFITVHHAQALAVVASYEAKRMLFTRSAITSAKCVRLADMMGLGRMDSTTQEIPPALGPATSWAELEERRRVFWGVFAIDAHASIATGWPNLINSAEVMTRLPASEEAFIAGKEEETSFLDEVFTGGSYSGFAGTIVICQIFKTIMNHTHRAKPTDNPDDLMDGRFWTRHRDVDNKLSGIFMFLPERFRLPQNSRDPAAIHTNLNLHASVICLHHAAIEMCEKHNHPDHVKRCSISRLKTSAEEIVNIVKMTAHSASIFKSPLCALSLYCATTVYVYLAKHEETVSEVSAIDIANLELVVQAMEAIGRHHEMTRSFLRQACLDIERNDLKFKINLPPLTPLFRVPGGIPLFARGQISKHTPIPPVLPGMLPLDNARSLPAALEDGSPDCRNPMPKSADDLVRGLINMDCFQPMLGAVSRNVSVPVPSLVDTSGHKRKRMSPSPGPDSAPNIGIFEANYGRKQSSLPDMQKTYAQMAPNLTGAGLWRAGGLSIRGGSGIVTTEFTNSSASSSPANRGTGTETQSGSSHTSPFPTGLGSTAEENRVDLRAFQDRISTPIWQSTEDNFLATISDSMVSSALPADGSDPWGLLSGDLNWDAIPVANEKPVGEI